MLPYFEQDGNAVYQGHVLDVLRGLPAVSVQCVVTSPPYWGLRDYGIEPEIWDARDGCEHVWGNEAILSTGRNDGDRSRLDAGSYNGGGPDKYYVGKQEASQGKFCQQCGAWRGTLGLEPTPELYVKHMVDVGREIRRVLRKDGTVWLNLGDSYAQSGGHNQTAEELKQQKAKGWFGDERGRYPSRATSSGRAANTAVSGLKPKDLIGIPWRVAFALQADGWWLRSDIIWSKPNPMPESVTDRPTKAHEYIFLLTKSDRYFYDADAVREPHADTQHTRSRYCYGPSKALKHSQNKDTNIEDDDFAQYFTKEDGKRNKRTVWTIATQPYPDAHFATFPRKLVEPCILAGTSEKGCCPECGSPWERVVEKPYMMLVEESRIDRYGTGQAGVHRPDKTIGWRPTCTCNADDPIPCVVMDPFGGSGTVALVAEKHGRRWILIEKSREYCDMAVKRIKAATRQLRMF